MALTRKQQEQKAAHKGRRPGRRTARQWSSDSDRRIDTNGESGRPARRVKKGGRRGGHQETNSVSCLSAVQRWAGDDANRCRAGETLTCHRLCLCRKPEGSEMDTLCLLFLCIVRTPGLGVRDTIPRVVISKISSSFWPFSLYHLLLSVFSYAVLILLTCRVWGWNLTLVLLVE